MTLWLMPSWAATSLEEQKRLVKEADMYAISKSGLSGVLERHSLT